MSTLGQHRHQVAQHTDLRSDHGTSPCEELHLHSLPLGGVVKRTIDLAIASFIMIFFLPLFGLIATTIAVFDGGPVLYRHPRLGHGGRPFLCWKFRTMVTNGDEILRQHLQSLPAAAREWAEDRKLKNDPRITVVGSVLRKFSLDELPQLINVLCGDMSIVGPRPIVADEVKMYGPHARYYFKARPGLTGAWQVSGRNDEKYENRVALDRAYVENWSLWKDVIIMLKTVPVVFNAKGSY